MAGKGGKRSTSFKPGQSGNPGGRPKAVGYVRDLAREHTDEAIETLFSLMSDEKQPGAVRRAAAVDLLDRGYGKPPQAITGEGGEGPVVFEARDWLRNLTDEQFQTLRHLAGTHSGAEPKPH